MIAVAVSFSESSAADSFADKIESLAAKCDELGHKEPAAATRGWLIPRHAGRQYLFVPAGSDPTRPDWLRIAETDVVKQWHSKFVALRREQAAALVAEAKAASENHQPARAYRLLCESVHEDQPGEYSQACHVLDLGYVVQATGKTRLRAFGRNFAERARLDHPRLQWRGGSYFRIESPHFQIVTDHSEHEGQKLAGQLELLHMLWQQIFFRYWSSEEALAARFAGPNLSLPGGGISNEPLARPRPKMQVVLFKNRDEYLAQLAPSEPKIASTVGYYAHKQRTTYFYAGDISVYPTWYHEATHQLFQESIDDTTDEPGEQRNFWAVEGAALYMESLAEHRGYWTAGGCEADRLQFARYRALSGEFLLPIERLAALGREQIQASEDIRPIYAQAAAVAHFLIDGEGGQYREAFIDLLSAVYSGQDTAETLAKATGQPLATLDQQFREFLNVTDDDLAGVPDVSRLRNLSLGRTSITDKGLAHLAGCKNLQWLDLSLTGATDEGLKPFASAAGLKKLYLEGTKIADASLPLIGSNFKQLEELDLSKLNITDGGLASLAALKNLKTLYLVGSPITDAGLTHLRGLKQLEKLETEGTEITADGLKRLKAVLPKLSRSP